MYIPKKFVQKDTIKSIAFMRAYNFALIISAKDDIPVATHLPFIIEERDKKIVLISHMSKANEQWKSFVDNEVLVIFNEPHAYISPTLYEKHQNVPTWNYVAVHAYGKVMLINEPEQQYQLLEKMMQQMEPAYLKQWKTLDLKYKESLRKEITAFEIIVSDLQAKEKLSQNKTQKERKTIKNYLVESEDDIKKSLGNMMPD